MLTDFNNAFNITFTDELREKAGLKSVAVLPCEIQMFDYTFSLLQPNRKTTVKD